MHRFAEPTCASPEAAWALLARPALWPRWSPHVRGAWGLAGAGGWVAPGRAGAARLLGFLPVPARILSVDEGRAWAWRVGPVTMDHRVEVAPDGAGCVVAIELDAPGPLAPAVAAAYGPVISLTLRRLARMAERRT